MSVLPPLVAVLGLLLCSGAPGAAQTKPRPATHTVTIDAAAFSPATLTLRPGDTIVWINKDLVSHTATSTLKKDKGGFDSGAIPPGASWKHTPKLPGTFAYICTFHPTMKGTVQVRK